MTNARLPRLGKKQQIGLGGAVLLALGVAGGAGAVALTRPTVTMAPTVQTPVARLSGTTGVVSIRGRVAEVYGDRIVVQDATGKALVDVGRDDRSTVTPGSTITVQGRFDDGQLRARYLVDAGGTVREVGPRHPGGRHGRPGGGPDGPDGPRPHGPDGHRPDAGIAAGPDADAPPPPPATAGVAAPAGAAAVQPVRR